MKDQQRLGGNDIFCCTQHLSLVQSPKSFQSSFSFQFKLPQICPVQKVLLLQVPGHEQADRDRKLGIEQWFLLQLVSVLTTPLFGLSTSLLPVFDMLGELLPPSLPLPPPTPSIPLPYPSLLCWECSSLSLPLPPSLSPTRPCCAGRAHPAAPPLSCT